jgi:DNA-directed RNA polymerase subunit RPC12/RpoP
MAFDCPVCGYRGLRRPPVNYLICSSCGTEFGYQDFAETEDRRRARWKELRAKWVLQDMPWFSRATPPPAEWNPINQLREAGLDVMIEVPLAHAGTSVKTFFANDFWTNESVKVA